MVTEKEVKNKLKEFDNILNNYREEIQKEVKNNYNYETLFMKRVKFAVRNLEPLVGEAVKGLYIHKGKGRESCLDLKQKTLLVLLQHLVGKSNRMLSLMLEIFSLLSGVDVSYKIVERLYSDEEVRLTLYNLNVLLLRKADVNEIEASGDATGYSLTVMRHYRTYAQRLKDKSKISDGKKKKFAYKFALMDLKTKMYVCYGTSLKSEKDAYNKAIKMLNDLGISVNTIRLDRYYSNPSVIKQFSNSFVYFIPKKNVTMQNGIKWNNTLTYFVEDTYSYLREFFKRNNSESEFGVDKKLFGWRVSKKREDRIDTYLFCRVVWRNLLRLGE